MPARLRSLARYADVAIVALLLVPLTVSQVGDLRMTGDARLFTVALVLPLLTRSRWPVPVFAVISLVALGQWLADVRAVGDVALLVALYTVALKRPTREALPAFALLEAGVLMASLRWAGGDELRVFIGLSGLSVAAAVLGISTRSRQQLVASLQERTERLERERDQQGQLAAAAERARIAREMHDIVAHNMSVMIALADGASYAAHDDPDRASGAMKTVSDTGRQALAEMRRLLGVLREDGEADGFAPQPGLAQLDALLTQVRAAGLPVGYEVSGPSLEGLAPGLQLALYRIVQEALTNALKHAGPDARAELRIRRGREDLQVEILNTGETVVVGPTAGGGLRGMRERAAVYDGEVEAGPRPDGGWRVHVAVPV